MRHLGSRWDWRNWIPAECPGCGRREAGQRLCPDCQAALAWGGDPRCAVCCHPLLMGRCPDCPATGTAYARVVVAFDYDRIGKQLVRQYKVQRQLSLASLLAGQLADAVERTTPASARPDWIVPIPSRRLALRQRGFSPPAQVARLLARRLGLVYQLDGLRRVREGNKQAVLGRQARLLAQQDCYACDSQRLAHGVVGARIAVVDDVLTTGATLQAACAVLKAAGAAHVEGWVLARALRRPPE